MARKVYGSQEPNITMSRPLTHAGDPEFITDSQNNDNTYEYDTDLRDSVRDG